MLMLTLLAAPASILSDLMLFFLFFFVLSFPFLPPFFLFFFFSFFFLLRSPFVGVVRSDVRAARYYGERKRRGRKPQLARAFFRGSRHSPKSPVSI